MMNKVQPIRDKQLVKDIYQYLLEQNSRDAVIYAVGIYTGLRISDILNLRVRDVRAKENITLYERKTEIYSDKSISQKSIEPVY